MFGTPEILIVSSQHYFENVTGNPVCIFCQSPKASFWRIFMRFAFPPPLVEAFAGSRQSMYRGESDPRGPGLLYSTPSPIPGIPLYHRTHHALTYPWTTNAVFFCSFLITCAFEPKPETRQHFASVHYSMKLVTVPQLYPPTVALYQPTYRSVQWGRTGVGRGKGLGRKD